MNGLREVPCRCGHEPDSHHERKHACLAMLCDCTEFADRNAPKPTPKRPDHVYSCRCYGCKEALGLL